MANNVTDLGKVGMTPAGSWSASSTYERLDVVTYEGSSYVSLVDSNINFNPSTSTGKWQLMAQHGEFTEQQLEDFKAEVVAESKEEMDSYTDEKKSALDTYEGTKETELNTYATGLKNDFDSNANSKTTDFNQNATEKTTAFNNNASTKTTAFNDNATSKTTTFNTNATNKTTDFDTNATNKTNDFNTNASDKTDDFNDNATAKTTAFDEHVDDKTDEFDEHTEEMQQEIDELSANMPWNTSEQATEIQVTDAAKYSKNKLELFGNTSQDSYQGYNLVDVSPYQEETKNGVTLTKDKDGNIILNGTSTSTIGWNVSLPETRLLPAGTYTKHITKDSSIGTPLAVSVGYNGRAITTTSIQPSRGTDTMTLEQDTNYDQVRIYIPENSIFNNYKLSYMIVSGTYTDETIPDYEPYTGGPSPNPNYPQDIHVVTGNNSIGVQSRNLFDENILKQETNYNTYDSTTQLWTTNSGGGYGRSILYNATGYSSRDINKLVPLTSAGTYTLKLYDFVNNTSYASTLELVLFDNEGSKISQATQSSNFIKFTIDSPCYLDLCRRNNSGTISFSKVILVKGDYTEQTLPDYVPYYHADYPINLGSIELCKIGDYQDYIYKENGNWYKYNAISKTTLNGSESWNSASSVMSGTIRFYTNFNDIINNSNDIDTENIYVASNKFTGTYWKDMYDLNTTNKFLISNINNNAPSIKRIVIRIDSTLANDVTTFKTWLSNNNTIVYYVKSTETTTQITDETLISQLDAIYEHLQLVKGTNNITVTAEDLAPYMELTYMQDLKSKLDNLDSRLTLLE